MRPLGEEGIFGGQVDWVVIGRSNSFTKERREQGMGGIQSTATLRQIADRLLEAEQVVLTTHVRPDGDAFGGTLSVARMLRRLGKRAEIWHMPPLQGGLMNLLGDEVVHLVGEDGMPSEDADLIVVVDTCAWSQLEDLRPYIESKRPRVCVIDHHIQGDDISDLCHADASAGSACEIIADLPELLGLELDLELATPIYLGIATDTGWFRFSNTSARTMRHAARLLETGVDHNQLLQLTEQCDRPTRLRLMGSALASLEFCGRGESVAVLGLGHAEYEKYDASSEDHHGFADFPLSVESIEMVCVITEAKAGVVKLSLRSKAGINAINVSDFAAEFGGGGHARASGAKITDRTFSEVRAAVIAAANRL